MSVDRIEFVVCAEIEHEPQFHELVVRFKEVSMFSSASFNTKTKLYEFKFTSICKDVESIVEIAKERLPKIKPWFLKSSTPFPINVEDVKFIIVTEKEATNKFNHVRTGGRITKKI